MLAADTPEACSLAPDTVVRGNRRIALTEIAAAATANGKSLTGTGRNDGTPRSIAFKSMSESPYNLISAAIGNALADAPGIRFCQTPLKPDRIFRAIADKFGAAD